MVLSLQVMKDVSCVHMRKKKGENQCGVGGKRRCGNVSFEKQTWALKGREKREEKG